MFKPKRISMRKIIIFLLCLCSSNLVQAKEAKLTRAYEERLIQRVRSVFSSKEEKSFSLPPRCATPIFLELSSVWDKLSQEAKNSLGKYYGRPTYVSESIYDTPGEHFKIHYTTIGEDSVFQAGVDVNPPDGVPDYVNRCADIFDSVWAKEVDSLGYEPPPSDDWYQPNGGDGRYDVYLKNINQSYYGYSQPESSLAAKPISYTSYIVVRNDYSMYGYYEDKLDILRVTAAHEFFHAIQFGYDATEFEYTDPYDPKTFKPYWMEMSAVWMEDVCYDQINDYVNYLPWFYDYPWLSLKTFSYNWSVPESLFHAYGSCVFPIFLSEKFGTDIIRRIWVRCSWFDSASFDFSTDAVLYFDYGSNLNEEFRQFTIWNYFTGVRADPTCFFSEGNLFDTVAVSQTHYSYPVYDSSIIHPPSNLASNYIRFVTGGSPGGLRIHFDGEDEAAWKVSLIGYKPALAPLLEEFDLDSLNQEGTLEVYNWQDYQEIILIPAVVNWDSAIFTYSYTAEFDSMLTEVRDEEVDLVYGSFTLSQNYPNPFNPVTRIQYTVGSRQTKTADGSFAHTTHERVVDGSQFMVRSPVHTTLRIYNVRGRLVRTLVDEEKPAGIYSVIWDGKDNQGNPVSSGIYLYKLKCGEFEKTKKMIIIK